MSGVLPSEELPSFFKALAEMGAKPRKSLRVRRDLAPEVRTRWTAEKFATVGIPIEERVSWYDSGYFFDLAKMEPHPSRHPAIASGLVFIQEAGAMEVVPALGVEPEHLVLDLCAAPGAKATHLGEYLGSAGWLVANEPDRFRAKLLDVILARHGISNSTVYNLEPRQLVEEHEGVFDRVLVDAPCSGESLFAKRTEKRSDVSDKEVGRCALRQSAILGNAWRMLAPGGKLVYSTCAYSRGENEEVVAELLASHLDARLLREQRRFPHRDGVPGGYFAVLEKAAIELVDRAVRRARLEEAVRMRGSKGLVRDRGFRWNGEVDAYARVMDRRETSFGGEEIELDLPSAERFLSGEGIPSHGSDSFVFLWEGERLAGGKGAEIYYPRGKLR